jgi:hypothetical protein
MSLLIISELPTQEIKAILINHILHNVSCLGPSLDPIEDDQIQQDWVREAYPQTAKGSILDDFGQT